MPSLILFSTNLPVSISLIATIYFVAPEVEFHCNIGFLSVISILNADDEAPGDFNIGFGNSLGSFLSSASIISSGILPPLGSELSQSPVFTLTSFDSILSPFDNSALI